MCFFRVFFYAKYDSAVLNHSAGITPIFQFKIGCLIVHNCVSCVLFKCELLIAQRSVKIDVSSKQIKTQSHTKEGNEIIFFYI